MPVAVSEEAAGGGEERSTCRGVGGARGRVSETIATDCCLTGVFCFSVRVRGSSHLAVVYCCRRPLLSTVVAPSPNCWLPPKTVLVFVTLRGSCWPGNSELRG